MLLGECKWGVVTERDLGLLEQRRDLILIARELRGTRHIHLALFAGKPITDRRLAKRVDAGEVLLFTPEDLLASSDVGKGP